MRLPELLNTSFYCSQAFKIVLEAEIQTISWYNWYLKKYRSSPIFLHISIGHKDFGKDWQFAIYDNSGSPNTVRLKVAKCIHRADKYIIVYWLGEPFFMVYVVICWQKQQIVVGTAITSDPKKDKNSGNRLRENTKNFSIKNTTQYTYYVVFKLC